MTKFKTIKAVLGLGGVVFGGGVSAAGFSLIEQSVSGLGNAFAGAAAIAEDASTIFYNPAGLARLGQNDFTVGLHLIRPSVKFTSQGSTIATGQAASGSNGGDAGGLNFVPNAYYAHALSDAWRIGIGINAPFGLKTDYEDGWVGRYQALKSEIKTININPSIAYRLSDRISLGAGIDAQYIKAELTRAIDFGTLCVSQFGQRLGSAAAGAAACASGGIRPGARDGTVKIEGTDWSYGFNLGALFQVSPSTRLGLAFRSKIKQELTGDASFSNPALPGPFAALTASRATTNGGVKANVTLPETLSLSAVTAVDSQWTLLGDITWTKWSRFDELRVHFDNGAPDSVTVENWKDAYRFSLGANYAFSPVLMLRAGVAYDQSPVKDEFRTARIPDQDRTWLSFGLTYKVGPTAFVDAGYTHLFVKNASLNKTEAGAGTLQGEYKTNTNIVSVQYRQSF
jgi:long-chain fatty acid transport protein